MNILILSDIHANYEALKVLQSHIEHADQVICLGDIVGYYCQVNEVIDYLKQVKPLCILGNHDVFLLKGCPTHLPAAVQFGITYANSVITAENRQWLASLPISWGGYIDQLSCLLVHGSPWRPLTDYLYADNPKLTELELFEYDVIAFGQTHRSLVRNVNKQFFLNPGSVGQSRDRQGSACALQWDTKNMLFQPIEIKYDTAPVLQLLQAHQ